MMRFLEKRSIILLSNHPRSKRHPLGKAPMETDKFGYCMFIILTGREFSDQEEQELKRIWNPSVIRLSVWRTTR